MDIAKQVEQIAVSTFLAILRATTENNGGFKMLITATVDGGAKPLLLIGTAHGGIEDGHVVAVLNPDKELCDELQACCGYTPFILKEIVAKRCDMMVHVGVSAYRDKPVDYVTTYQAQKIKPAKFLVR
ncbi:MAG: hypothetical protein U1A72_02865 [Sulfuritalea sp.]|nr:hypothetical protein [Sulfuritalea sp.]